jgi:hypothetical protein
MKSKKYQSDGTVPKSNRKIVETEERSMLPYAHIHDRSLSWLDTGTSTKSGRVKLVVWAQTSLLVK